MAEFIIATNSIEELRRELAVSAVTKKALELTIASGSGSRKILFLTTEVAQGSEAGEIFFGQAGSDIDAEMFPSLIETEDRLLILHVDEI